MRHLVSSRSRTVWLKGLALFLLIMLACTVLSRVAASFTVAQVSTAKPMERRIEHTVTAGGLVEKNKERVIFTQPDILVKSVSVKVGQSVKKGSVLLQLDLKSLQEQIDLVENSIVQIEDSIARAKEDESYTRAKTQWEVEVAAKKLQKAKNDLEKYRRRDHYGEDKTEGAQLADAVAQAQEDYDSARMTQEDENRKASRAIEDAQNSSGENGTLDRLYLRREKLNRLKDKNGRVCASRSGVITEVVTDAGQKTADTAAIKMTDNRAGFRFVAQLTKEEAKYASVGDDVTVTIANREMEGVKIDTIEADESGETLTVTVIIPAQKLSIGQSGEMTISRDSEKYPCTIPLMAVSEENNRSFIYVVDQKDTVLGTQNVARKVEVKVLDKNDSYAALEANSLDFNSQVIVDMDRYVEEGDEVRLTEN